jgi:hypothetical protein
MCLFLVSCVLITICNLMYGRLFETNMAAFWYVAPCSLVDIDGRFRAAFSWESPSIQLQDTERRSRVVNAPASYSGSSGFKSRPGDRLS